MQSDLATSYDVTRRLFAGHDMGSTWGIETGGGFYGKKAMVE